MKYRRISFSLPRSSAHRILGKTCSVALTLLAFALSPVWAADGEFATYRYELVMSKDDKVCKHMQGVYNWSFARPFDYRGFPKTEQIGSGAMPPLPSKYPTSEEFDAVPWQYPKIFSEDGSKFFSLPVAEFDIDNDGRKDIVVKTPFGGASDTWDTFYVYSRNELDLRHTVVWKDLLQGSERHRPRIVENGQIMRPLILGGTSYVSSYSFARSDGIGKSGVHQPPQTMEIQKYLSGGVRIPGEETPLKLEVICKFNMLRVPQ